MTAPVRPLTMRDVLRAYALGERMNDWVLASRAVSHLVPQGSPNYDLCAEMCRLHASTCENDFIGLAEHIVNDATLARLAEVEQHLAASQAHAKALREALDDVWAAIGDALCSGGGIEKEYAWSVQRKVKAALTLPADTSALDAERAKAWEQAAAVADRHDRAIGDTIRQRAREALGPVPAAGGRETR